MLRDEQTFRDDRLIIIACDDTYAPKQYFRFFCFPRAHVYLVETTDDTSAAAAVLERPLSNVVDDERWLLLEIDHYIQGSHIASFLAALRKARQINVRVVLSRPFFEPWALLHHVDETQAAPLPECTAVTLRPLS